MKKASAVALAFFIFSLGEIRGQVYFDNLYGDSLSADGIPSGGTIAVSGGYLILSTMYRSLTVAPWAQDDHFGFVVDSNGDFEFGFDVENSDTISEFGGTVIQYDDTLLVGMSRWSRVNQQSSEQGDVMLTGFNSEGLIHWRKKYGDPIIGESPGGFVRTNDSGFAVIGQNLRNLGTQVDGQLYLLRINAEKDSIWQGSYGGNENEWGSSLVQTPDSGFLLLGYTRSYGAGQRDFYLVKTDSVGNQEWQRTYGGSDMETGTCIIALSDGNYLLAGAQILGGVDKGKLIKIDPDGNVIWQNEYLYPGCSASEINKVIELSDGTIIGAGVSDKSNEGNSGWLLKTDSEGNEIWQRKYNKNNNTDLFYSVLLANDGGFLLSGQARNAETNSQDAWLLKIDSVGCPYPNCLVGVDEVEKSKVVVDVWPNPASEVVNVEFQERGMAEFLFMDMAGRVMCRGGDCFGETLAMTGRGAMDVSTFQNGLYLLTIIQGEMKTTLKVVVEH